MWQILLIVIISISFASCDTNYCPGFSNYQNDATLVDNLNGEYRTVYSTSDIVLGCERISWTVGPDNNRTAYLKDSDGCCRRIDNFDSSNPDYILYDIAPLTSCNYLKSTEKVHKKVIAVTGTGMDLCMIFYFCNPSRNGLTVACRQQPPPTLWNVIGNILSSLLSLLFPPTFKTVNQSNCIFSNNCYF